MQRVLTRARATVDVAPPTNVRVRVTGQWRQIARCENAPWEWLGLTRPERRMWLMRRPSARTVEYAIIPRESARALMDIQELLVNDSVAHQIVQAMELATRLPL